MLVPRIATNTAVLVIGIIVVASIESSYTGTIDDIDHCFLGCSAMMMTMSMSTVHRIPRPITTTMAAAHSSFSDHNDALPPGDIHDDHNDNSCDSSSSSSTPTTQDYWKLRTQRRQYERDNKILYVKSALTPTEFATISSELSTMMQSTKTPDSTQTIMMMKLQDEDASSSFATNRIGARVPINSNTYDILRHGSISRIVNGLYENTDMILAPNIPIEIRIYEKAGAGMGWHVDDVLYCPRQVEIVMTLENTSDCCTMWRVPMKEENDDDSDDDDDDASPPSHRTNKTTSICAAAPYTTHSIQTAPNSILILESGGVEHKVTPLSYGKRTILKMAFVPKHAVMDETMERHASHHHHHLASRTPRPAATDDQKKRRKNRR